MSEREFVESIMRHKGIIHNVCNSYCKIFERDDLVQEIILEAFKSINNFKKNCKFSTWLHYIARNKCIDTLRRQKSKLKTECIDAYANVLADSDNTPELIKQLEQAMCYSTVLDTLDASQRIIFEMHLDGLSYEEISLQTGINENYLRVMNKRIKDRLSLRYGRESIR